MHYKPTDSHNYLLHSPSHPQHVKNAIPFPQFVRLRHLCSDDADFNDKCDEMCQFFKKTEPPWLCCYHRQTSSPRNWLRNRTTNITERRNQQNSIHSHLPSTKPCSQNCHSQKLQNSPQWSETKHMFPLPPLISFKRDKNIGTVTFSLEAHLSLTINQPETFKMYTYTIQNLSLYF